MLLARTTPGTGLKNASTGDLKRKGRLPPRFFLGVVVSGCWSAQTVENFERENVLAPRTLTGRTGLARTGADTHRTRHRRGTNAQLQIRLRVCVRKSHICDTRHVTEHHAEDSRGGRERAGDVPSLGVRERGADAGGHPLHLALVQADQADNGDGLGSHQRPPQFSRPHIARPPNDHNCMP